MAAQAGGNGAEQPDETSIPGGSMESSQGGMLINRRGRAIKPTTRWEDEAMEPQYHRQRRPRKSHEHGEGRKHGAPPIHQYGYPGYGGGGMAGAAMHGLYQQAGPQGGKLGKKAQAAPPPQHDLPMGMDGSADMLGKRPSLSGSWHSQEQRPRPDLLELVPVAASEAAVRSSHVLDENGVPIDATFNWGQLTISQDSTDAYRADRIWSLASSMFATISPAFASALLGLHKPAEELLREDPALMVPPLGSVYRRELIEEEEELRPDPDGSLRLLMELSAPVTTVKKQGGRKSSLPPTEEEAGQPGVPPPKTYCGRVNAPEPFRVRVTTCSEEEGGKVLVRVDDGEEEELAIEEEEAVDGAKAGEDLRLLKLWGTGIGPQGPKDSDVVLHELEQLQTKLLNVMRRNLAAAGRLRDRMGEAFGEAQAKYPESARRRDIIARYKAVISKKEQEREEELLRMAEEDQSSCAVCSSGDSTSGVGRNPIVFCDKCGLAVHQRCYRIAVLPAGEWLCKSCEDQRANGQGDDVPVTRICALCPNLGGAFVPTACNQWVHVACAIWMGLLEEDGSVPAIEPRLTLLRRRYLAVYRCCVPSCRDPFMGGLIGCMDPCGTCRLFFHLTCARMANQEVYQGHLFEELQWKAFCGRHTNPSRYEAKKKEVEAKQEAAAAQTREEVGLILEVSPQYLELWDEQEQVAGLGAGKKPANWEHDKGFLTFQKELELRRKAHEDVEARRKADQAAYQAKLAAMPPPPPPPQPVPPAPVPSAYQGEPVEAPAAPPAGYANGYPAPPDGEAWGGGPGDGRYTSHYAPGAAPPYYNNDPREATAYYEPYPEADPQMAGYPPPQPGYAPPHGAYPGEAGGGGADAYGGGVPGYKRPPPEVDTSQAGGKRQRGGPSSPRTFECPGCGAVFGSNSNLTRHKRESCQVLVHGKPRPKTPPTTKFLAFKNGEGGYQPPPLEAHQQQPMAPYGGPMPMGPPPPPVMYGDPATMWGPDAAHMPPPYGYEGVMPAEDPSTLVEPASSTSPEGESENPPAEPATTTGETAATSSTITNVMMI